VACDGVADQRVPTTQSPANNLGEVMNCFIRLMGAARTALTTA